MAAGRRRARPIAATAVTSVVFALYHLPSLAAEAHGQVVGTAAGLLPLLAFGLVFALLRVVTRGLAVPAAVHLAFDIVPIGK